MRKKIEPREIGSSTVKAFTPRRLAKLFGRTVEDTVDKIVLSNPEVILEVGRTKVLVQEHMDRTGWHLVAKLWVPGVDQPFIGVRPVYNGFMIVYRLEQIMAVAQVDDDDGPDEGFQKEVLYEPPLSLAA